MAVSITNLLGLGNWGTHAGNRELDQIPCAQLPMPNPQLLMPNSQHPTPNPQFQIPDSQIQLSNPPSPWRLLRLPRLERQLRFDGHALLEDSLAVVHGHLDPVHELRSLLRGLDVAWRELGLRGDERDGALDARA